jgi:hypothetical protein
MVPKSKQRASSKATLAAQAFGPNSGLLTSPLLALGQWFNPQAFLLPPLSGAMSSLQVQWWTPLMKLPLLPSTIVKGAGPPSPPRLLAWGATPELSLSC